MGNLQPNLSRPLKSPRSFIPEKEMQPIYKANVFMIGSEKSVGQTSIATSFKHKRFIEVSPHHDNTMLFPLEIDSNDGSLVKLNLWDEKGERRNYLSIALHCHQGAKAMVLTYDITRRESFNEVIDFWVHQFSKEGRAKNMIVFLVGNKADLEHQREVDTCYGATIARRYGMFFREVSAKTLKGIDELFESIAEECIHHFKRNEN